MFWTIFLIICACLAVALLLLAGLGWLVGSLVKRSRKGKSAPAAQAVAAPLQAMSPEDVRRQQLITRAADRVGKRFDAKVDAELDAEIDALNAPVK